MSINEFMHRDVIVVVSDLYGTGYRGVLVRATRDHLYLENANLTSTRMTEYRATMWGPDRQNDNLGRVCVKRGTIMLTSNRWPDAKPIDGAHLLDRELVKRKSRKRIEEIKNRNKPGFIATRIKKVKDVWVEMIVGTILTVGVMYLLAMTKPIHG